MNVFEPEKLRPRGTWEQRQLQAALNLLLAPRIVQFGTGGLLAGRAVRYRPTARGERALRRREYARRLRASRLAVDEGGLELRARPDGRGAQGKSLRRRQRRLAFRSAAAEAIRRARLAGVKGDGRAPSGAAAAGT